MSPATRKLISVTISALLAGPLVAQEPSDSARTRPSGVRAFYKESNVLVRTVIRVPERFDSSQAYPLVVGLHGFGSNPDEFLLLSDQFSTAGIIFAAPQAPYALEIDGGRIGYDWSLRSSLNEELAEHASELSVQYILQVVAQLTQRYQVTELYLLGFSQGGGFAYLASVRQAQFFDGVIVLGSGFRTSWFEDGELEAARRLPVFIGHGTLDEMAAESSAHARDFLTELGYDVTYRTFEGGHWVPEEMLTHVLEWMAR